MIELNNKPFRGKRILVTQANESQYQEHQAANQSKTNHSHQNNSNHQGRPGQRGRPAGPDPMRPTTLSILKSQQQPKGVNNKIAALEAKLASMQQTGNSSKAPSSSESPLLSSTSSLLSSKPSFLPENPNTLHPGAHNQIPSSRRPDKPSTSTKKSCKNSATSYNHSKNSPSLDAIGLTLKEQLKRNRESKSIISRSSKLARTADYPMNDAALPRSISTDPKHSRSGSANSINHVQLSSGIAHSSGCLDVPLPVAQKPCEVISDT